MIRLSILCSLDSFLAAAGLSLAGCPDRYRRWLTLGFGVCDMGAALAGARLHVSIPADASALMWAMALAVAWAARKRPAMYLMLPLILCLDNMATPVSPIWGGACSAVAAACGFALGGFATRELSRAVVEAGK